jgi:hypothetical protein
MTELWHGMTEKEAAEHNAVAWLKLTDRELIERSASLGLDAELHPEAFEPTGRLATYAELDELRANADAVAAEHTSKAFVKKWIAKNRQEDDHVRPA